MLNNKYKYIGVFKDGKLIYAQRFLSEQLEGKTLDAVLDFGAHHGDSLKEITQAEFDNYSHLEAWEEKYTVVTKSSHKAKNNVEHLHTNNYSEAKEKARELRTKKIFIVAIWDNHEGKVVYWSEQGGKEEEYQSGGDVDDEQYIKSLAEKMFRQLSEEAYSPEKNEYHISNIAIRRMMDDGLLEYDTEVDHDDEGRATGSQDFYWFNDKGRQEVKSAEDLIDQYMYSSGGGSGSESPFLRGRESYMTDGGEIESSANELVDKVWGRKINLSKRERNLLRDIVMFYMERGSFPKTKIRREDLKSYSRLADKNIIVIIESGDGLPTVVLTELEEQEVEDASNKMAKGGEVLKGKRKIIKKLMSDESFLPNLSIAQQNRFMDRIDKAISKKEIDEIVKRAKNIKRKALGGMAGGTKNAEYRRSIELFEEIFRNKGAYFALAFLYDSQYDRDDILAMMEILKPGKGKISDILKKKSGGDITSGISWVITGNHI